MNDIPEIKGYKRVIGLILAAVLAFFTVLVEHVRRSGAFMFNTPAERAATALQVIFYIVFFILGWKLIDWFDKKAVIADPCESNPSGEASAEDAEPDPAVNVPAVRRRHLFTSWNVRSVILTAILLFVLFLPYLIVFYPGVASKDTYNQIKDFITGTMPIEINWNAGEPMISCFLNDHHPVLDTLIFVFFTEFVGGLAGGAARGAFIYSCLQTALTALAMSLMLCRMEKLGIPYLYRKAGVLFLGLSPFVALYAIGMTKDSIYSLIFIFYYLVYVLIIREEATNGRMLWLILLSVLLAATKKTGVYFVLLCNLVLPLMQSGPDLRAGRSPQMGRVGGQLGASGGPDDGASSQSAVSHVRHLPRRQAGIDRIHYADDRENMAGPQR